MPNEFDVIVIGGGVTGAGIARDCAMRGLKTLLLEKNDFSSGTTGTCMGMLHGGARYIATDPEVTRESCIESGIIQKLIPHIIFRIPYLGLVFKGSKFDIHQYEALIQKYDEVGKFKFSKPHTILNGDESRKLEPSLSKQIDSAIVYDEPGVSPFALVVANALSAAEHGAEVRNHTQVMKILRSNSQVYGVETMDRLTGVVSTLHAAYVINAAGPWTPIVAALAGIHFKLRPTKGTHLIFDRHITGVALTGFGVTLLPHENTTVCGLTDDFFFPDPDEARVDRNEVEYLVSSLEKAVPNIRQARIIRAMTGVRPIIDQPGANERDLSRQFKLYDHQELDHVKGFLTIAGGKMVTYRLMAEEMTNLVCKKLGNNEPCRTHVEPLPGGEKQISPLELADQYGYPLHTMSRLVARHGSRAGQVLEEAAAKPSSRTHICECEPVTEAEIQFCVRHLWARSVDDIRRRARLGVGPCQGAHCTGLAASILSCEQQEPPESTHQHVLDFLQERWKGRAPSITGTQLRQEELYRASYLSVGGYHNLENEGKF
jgi:glycerol-3-phosphate dehydrogenase